MAHSHTAVTTGLQHKLLIALATLALAIGLLPGQAFADTTPTPSSDKAVEISDGYVIWGIKYSWRKYAWTGQEVSDGLEIIPSGVDEEPGLYKWPIADGTYDPETKTTILNLDGTIHYKLYCSPEHPDVCALDSIFRDLQVVISPEEQVIRGTYIGRPQDNPGGPMELHEGVLATLNLSEVSPDLSNSHTTWTDMPSVAGDQLTLYPEGVDIDPATIHYTGPGGKPHIKEKWAIPGSPYYEKTHEWQPAEEDGDLVYFPTSSGKHIVAMHFPHKAEGVNSVFTVLTPETLTPVATHDWVEPRSWTASGDDEPRVYRGPVTWDPDTATLFFVAKSARTLEGRRIYAAHWNEQTEEFSVDLVDQISAPLGGSVREDGGIFSWDSKNNRLLYSVRTSLGGDTPPLQELLEYTPTSTGWEKEIHPIELPTGAPDVPEKTRIHDLFNEQHVRIGCDVWIDDHLICARPTYYTNEAGKLIGTPVLDIWAGPDGSWKSRYISSTMPSSYDPMLAGRQSPFSRTILAADGGLLLGGAGGTGEIRWLDDALGDPQAHDLLVDKNITLENIFIGAVDQHYGFDIGYSSTPKKLRIFKDRQLISSITAESPNSYHPQLTSIEPGTVYLATGFYESPHAIMRYAVQAVAPTVIQDPVDQQVDLLEGATSDEAIFSVEFEAMGDTTVQWQERPVGAEYFQNIDGANSASLSVDATLAKNGTVYRAVMANVAGKVSSAEATLSVRSAPRFLDQPTDVTGQESDIVTFTAPVSPDIAATGQVWQVKTEDGWQNLTDSEDVTVNGDTLIVTATAGRNGEVYRSVISNEVGSTVSAEATLTVIGAASEPHVTQHPVSRQVAVGQSVEFTAAASGTPEPTVIWQQRIAGGTWTDISDATTPSLLIPDATLGQSGVEYRAVFTNDSGQVASQPATLTVIDPTPPPAPKPEPEPEPEPTPDPVPDPGQVPGIPGGPGATPPPDDSPEPAPQPSAPATHDPGEPTTAPSSPASTRAATPSPTGDPAMPSTGADLWALAAIALMIGALGTALIYQRYRS